MKVKIKNSGNIYIALVCIYWLIASMTFPVLSVHLINKGINIFQLGLIVSLATCFYVILDIPIGYLSDIIRKKYIFTAGMLLHSAGYFLWSHSSTITMALTAYCIWSIGRSFYSGVLESWYVNSIKDENRQEKINRTFNISSIGVSLCIGFGTLISLYISIANGLDYLSLQSTAYILQVSSILMLIIGFFSYFLLIENSRNNKQENKEKKYQFNKLRLLINSPRFLKYLPLSFSYGLSFGFFEVFWMPLSQNLNISDIKASIAYASAYFCCSITLFLLIKLNKTPKNRDIWIPALRTAFGLSFLIMAYFNSVHIFFLSIIMIYVLSFVEQPIFQTGINASINDDYRTTMLSIESVVKQSAGIISGTLGGFVYHNYGAATALSSISFAIILSVVLYLLILKAEKQIHT